MLFAVDFALSSLWTISQRGTEKTEPSAFASVAGLIAARVWDREKNGSGNEATLGVERLSCCWVLLLVVVVVYVE
jgi:hypothetical protein